jgi:hypothetical protein
VDDEAITTPSTAVAAMHAAEREKKAAIPLLVMHDGTTYCLASQLMKG